MTLHIYISTNFYIHMYIKIIWFLCNRYFQWIDTFVSFSDTDDKMRLVYHYLDAPLFIILST